MRLAVVTATLDYDRAEPCIQSWLKYASEPLTLYVVQQLAGNADWERVFKTDSGHVAYGLKSRDILGPVAAFGRGVQQALHDGADVVACFHDDLEIYENWSEMVHIVFQNPTLGLAGFGGAKGLGSEHIYQAPYDPMQLARVRFGSNMRDAEAHGERWTRVERIACLDGFSQIGRRHFWLGRSQRFPNTGSLIPGNHLDGDDNLLTWMYRQGIIHHAYDSALGAFAHRLGWETWFLPIKVHHFGGLTAVADPRYQRWAAEKTGLDAGDAAFWERSHARVYDLLKGALPIRID